MDDIRVLLVGFGEMGRFHLRTLRSRPGTRVVGIVRRSPDATEPDIPTFTQLADGLGLGPQLAIVSTPHSLHYEQARECLEAGCHVLVEKPLTLRYAESVALAEFARVRGLHLVVGLQRRYEGLCRVFRATLADGSLGAVQFVHGLFAHRFSPDHLRGWRLEAAAAGAGILDDSALHLIDLVLLFAGGRITAVDARVLEGSGIAVPHSFVALLDSDSGALISASGSYLSPAASVQEEISILGTRGSLFARRFCRQWNSDPPAVFYKSADGTVAQDYDLSGYPVGKALPLLALLDVLQQKAPADVLFTAADQVLETHRVVELIRTSARRCAGEPGA